MLIPRRNPNPLIAAIDRVHDRVTTIQTIARDFYVAVLRMRYRCPHCGQKMKVLSPMTWRCSCGVQLDPTIEFQASPCCKARLTKKVYHYACAQCGATVPSKFLFDERLFDAYYFRERMKESRERKQQLRDRMRKQREDSRSNELELEDYPQLDTIPGLEQDLDRLIGAETGNDEFAYDRSETFCMTDYRCAISALVNQRGVLFSQIPALHPSTPKDRIWRFITLIFMEHDREIHLRQEGNDIWVFKRDFGEEIENLK